MKEKTFLGKGEMKGRNKQAFLSAGKNAYKINPLGVIISLLVTVLF